MAVLPVFCFMDESGTIGGNTSRYFAIGAIVHPWPDDLIQKLHAVFDGLVSECRKNRTEQEFHFTDLTLGTLPHFMRAIDALESDDDWRFFSVVLDLNDPLFGKPEDHLAAWACYLRWIKIGLQKNIRANEKATVIIDFLRKPKGKVNSLSTLPKVVPQVWDVLQVCSQGVLLVQMADVLLGASLYEGKAEGKLKLAARVGKLRASIPKSRFNEWRVRWDR